jgi:GntR family transcriptional repressor for pyruvate dehydrogenase complex
MLIKPFEKKSLVDQVEERILDHIRDGKLETGDKLPTELELTKSLGVSRTIIREALSRLRMLGLLESKKKRGLILCEPDVFSRCSQMFDAAFLSDETQQDLYEMRLILEIGLAESLFMHKTDEGLEELKCVVTRTENAANEKTRVKLDAEFHRTLYKIAGNNLLYKFQ